MEFADPALKAGLPDPKIQAPTLDQLQTERTRVTQALEARGIARPTRAQIEKITKDSGTILQRRRALDSDSIEFARYLVDEMGADISLFVDVMKMPNEADRVELGGLMAGKIRLDALSLAAVMLRSSSKANPSITQDDRVQTANIINESLCEMFQHHIVNALDTVPPAERAAFAERALQGFEMIVSADRGKAH
jgi:hypothetical protein